MGCTARPGANAPALKETRALPFVVVASGKIITWLQSLHMDLRLIAPDALRRESGASRLTAITCIAFMMSPATGALRFSCATTIKGKCLKKMKSGSANVTWLLTRIGASWRGAGFPLTWIHWNPQENKFIRAESLTGNNNARRQLGNGFVNTFFAPSNAILVVQYPNSSDVTNNITRSNKTGSKTSVFTYS